MHVWKDLLDSLDSHGGRIFIMITLTVFFVLYTGDPANRIVDGLLLALMAVLRGERQANGVGKALKVTEEKAVEIKQ